MKLEAFYFKNRWWLLIVTLPVPLIVFAACFSPYWLFTGPGNTLTFSLSLILFLISITKITRLIARKCRFVSIGQIRLDGNELLLSQVQESFTISDSTKVSVHYAGDEYWKSSFRPIRWYRQQLRYDHLRYTFNQSQHLDYIEVGGRRIYIKIKGESDKEGFIELVTQLKSLSPGLKSNVKLVPAAE